MNFYEPSRGEIGEYMKRPFQKAKKKKVGIAALLARLPGGNTGGESDETSSLGSFNSQITYLTKAVPKERGKMSELSLD